MKTLLLRVAAISIIGLMLGCSTPNRGEKRGLATFEDYPRFLPETTERFIKIVTDSIQNAGNAYCTVVFSLKPISGNPDLSERRQAEARLALKICDSDSQFVGFHGMQDPNAKVIAEQELLDTSVLRALNMLGLGGAPWEKLRNRYIRATEDWKTHFHPQVKKIYDPLLGPIEAAKAIGAQRTWVRNWSDQVRAQK